LGVRVVKNAVSAMVEIYASGADKEEVRKSVILRSGRVLDLC
jgi:hypothetical protein